jgi:integrase/recombinase XerD
MIKHNANNERIKYEYFGILRELKGHAEESVNAVAAALARFEQYTKYRDFKNFHVEQAIAFKKHLADQNNAVTGKKLSKATIYASLAQLKRFFEWLSTEPGYRSRLRFKDAGFFKLSEKDSRIATARRSRPVPTLEQIRHVLAIMPTQSDIERRDRAVIAFALLTGARDSAIASMKLKHVDLISRSVFQDARQVKTKFSKTFTTYFFPVGDDVRAILVDWVNELRVLRLWGNEDPLFPATNTVLGKNLQWEAAGLIARHWSNATPIRGIFRKAFAAAGLPYFNPHSLRNTLVRLGETTCQTPEQFKAWSQNLGHEAVLTTFTSYGEVAAHKQGEIIHALGNSPVNAAGESTDEMAEALLRKMLALGLVKSGS